LTTVTLNIDSIFIKKKEFIYLMTVFSADTVDGGVQTACIDDLSLFDV
jgi:hypothetical protein